MAMRRYTTGSCNSQSGLSRANWLPMANSPFSSSSGQRRTQTIAKSRSDKTGVRAASGDALRSTRSRRTAGYLAKKGGLMAPFYFLGKVGYTYMHDLILMWYRIMHIGAIVEYRRRRLGLTQEELAERSGLSQAQVSRLESGKSKNITIESLRSIARVL